MTEADAPPPDGSSARLLRPGTLHVVVGYHRGEAGDGAALSVLAAFAAARRFTLRRVHHDERQRQDVRRPGFAAALRDVHGGAFGVVVPGLDHLSENDLLARALMAQVHAAGGRLFLASVEQG